MKPSLLFKTCRVALPVAAMAMMAACVDDLGLGADKPSKLEQVYFTASIAEQKPPLRTSVEQRWYSIPLNIFLTYII